MIWVWVTNEIHDAIIPKIVVAIFKYLDAQEKKFYRMIIFSQCGASPIQIFIFQPNKLLPS